MKRLIIVLLFAFTVFSQSYAQEYNTGIGLRGGFFSGLTVKHFLDPQNAIEGILSSRWHGFDLAGLYEVHNPVLNVIGLNWYYGAGAHMGFWDGDDVDWGNDDNYTVIGLDGILGIEYSFTEIPVNIGIDWKPALNVFGHSSFWGDGGAISVRYIF